MDNGSRTSEMVRGSINTPQVIHTKDSGRGTRKMEWVCSRRSRERGSEKSGKKTSSSRVRLSSEF